MKNYLERFVGNPHSFQRKIITIYLVLTIIPMLLIALIITGVYYQRILDSAYNILNENAQQHEIIVQERMENYENVMYELVADSEFINLAKMYNISDSVDELKIKKILSNGINTYDQIRAAVFLSDSGKYVSYSRWYGSQYDSIWSESKKRTEIYDEVNNNQALTFIATVNIGIEEVRDDQAILMGFPVRDLRTQEQSGVLIIALDDNCLLFNSESESSVKGVETVIIDDYNKIIAGTKDKFINISLDSYLGEIYKNVSTLEIRKYPIQSTQWSIVHIIDRAIYREDIYHTLWAVIIIVVIVVVIVCALVWGIFGRYIGNIQKISQGLRNYEGKQTEELKVDVNKEDELYTIVRQFNKMTVRINHLVETLEKKNIEIQEAAISQKHAEIKALEAQINPHFLYNVLDTINWMARKKGEDNICHMVTSISSLMRASISNKRSMVYIREEIKYVQDYLYIQETRYGDKFTSYIEVDERLNELEIPKMTIQTLVENAVVHGVENATWDCFLYVSGEITDGMAVFTVKDDGVGMSQEQLEKLMGTEEEPDHEAERTHTHLGVYAVRKRLDYVYQNKARMSITSEPGKGTQVILEIPMNGNVGVTYRKYDETVNENNKKGETRDNGIAGNDIR